MPLSSTGAFEVAVDGIRDVAVGSGQGVGVLAQGGGGIRVTETGLRLQDLAACHQEGGDAVPEAMQ